MSHVTCHMSHVYFFFIYFFYFYFYFLFFFDVKKLDKVVELVGGGSVINKPTLSSSRIKRFTLLRCQKPRKVRIGQH